MELNTNIDPISQKVEQADKGPYDLEAIEVKLSDNISKPEYVVNFNIDGAKFALGTKGNFSVVSGKAKSRKSFFIDIIVYTQLLEAS
jgi:hypothetical protein